MKWQTHFGRAAALITLWAMLSAALAAGGAGEDELKSATLLAFIQNAHWAEQSPPNSPLTVAVVGRPSLIRLLSESLQGKSVNGRPLRIAAITDPPDPRCCQVVYFATDKPSEIGPILTLLNSAHVLTIGESRGFLEQGGAVNLFLVDGHMAFEVSLAALGRAGVEISSKLLRFGQIHELAKGRQAR